MTTIARSSASTDDIARSAFPLYPHSGEPLLQSAARFNRWLKRREAGEIVDHRQPQQVIQPDQNRLRLPCHPTVEKARLDIDDDDREIIRLHGQRCHGVPPSLS